MAKELPYFRFYPSEWLEGNITLENEKVQGFFIQLCAWYWKKDCEIDLKFINKRLIKGKVMLKQCLNVLIDSDIIKVNDNKTVSVLFLDEQFEILSEKRQKKIDAGRKGGKASVKQRSSYKDNNKDNYNNNISIDNDQTLNSSTDIFKFLNELDEEKVQGMIELAQFKGDLTELKQKFSVEFIGRYGLNKTKEEVLSTFQSWMNRDKNLRKPDSLHDEVKKESQKTKIYPGKIQTKVYGGGEDIKEIIKKK
jgi:hypothetical protein